jgi:hypothetical protein
MNPAFAAWAGAALYDAAAVVGIGEAQLASNLRAGALRLGRWAAESMLPGDKLPWAVSFGPAVVAGVDGKPVASLAPYFADGRAVKHDAGIDAGAWAYRGIACAAALGDPTAAAVAPKLLAKWQGDRASWPFLVGPDWSYAAPGARAAAGE